MSPSNLVRSGGGLVSVASGVLLVAGHVLELGENPEYGTILGKGMILAAHEPLVFALAVL